MNQYGPFAFVCYDDTEEVTGDQAARTAKEQMHDMVVGTENM